jgi:hypothetical protein
MSDDTNPSIEAEITARLVAEAQATIPRDMAEFKRIAILYKIDADMFARIMGEARGWTPGPTTSVLPILPPYDGTFAGLIDCYFTDKRSPFRQLKHSVSVSYGTSFKRMSREIGKELVADWNAQIIRSHYERWADGGKIAMGHEMIGKLRLLSSFGVTELNDDACIRLNSILSTMRFPVSKGDGQPRFTRDQARAIRITAREHFGWDSIAFAIALQLELPKLRQVDIIGEWVPIGDSAKSEIMKGTEKWVTGLRWSDLDENMVLRRVITSGRRNQQKPVEYSLKRSQMIMEEINRVPVAKRNGPMIICEFSGIPWSPNEFRRKLKLVAEKAGVSQSTERAGDSELEAEEAS